MTVRRFDSHFTAKPERVSGLPAHHPAVMQGRTLFPTSVIEPKDSPRLLISGVQQRKIGDRVTKGRWKGMPIFCLTLEERATCPASCHHWRSCYGNGMPYSRRHKHGPDLEYLLAAELREKADAYPNGFVVRLHILGDFYDTAYAALWGRWLDEFPALRVFGFTARPEDSDIGMVLRALNNDVPERFVIRFSRPKAGGVRGVRYATTLWETPETPTVDGAVVCPVQTEKTACCATCGLCWATDKAIAFIAHGKSFNTVAEESHEEPVAASRDLPQAKSTLTGCGRPSGLRLASSTSSAQPARRGRPPGSINKSTHIPRTNVVRNDNLKGRIAESNMLPATVELGTLDPDHHVPATIEDIAAWFERAGYDSRQTKSDEHLITLANKLRRFEKLPLFKLDRRLKSIDQTQLTERDLAAADI
jgi:hypothetical protein